jgi:hypothetical protein
VLPLFPKETEAAQHPRLKKDDNPAFSQSIDRRQAEASMYWRRESHRSNN